MIGPVCERCGFTPKRPFLKLYYSAMARQTICIDGAACNRRVERAARKET